MISNSASQLPHTFRYPLRNRIIFLLSTPFCLTIAWVLYSSGKPGLWGLAIVMASAAVFGLFAAWFYSGSVEVSPHSIRRLRILGVTEIPWPHASVEDYGIALKIQAVGASMQIYGDLEDWPELCDFVARFAPEEPPRSLPLTVHRGWGFIQHGALALLLLWLLFAPLFIDDGRWLAASAGASLLSWCAFALYWRSTGWVFEPDRIRWIHPWRPREWSRGDLQQIALVRSRHHVRYRGVRQAVPAAALRLDFQNQRPIVIPSQDVDAPIGNLSRALKRLYQP